MFTRVRLIGLLVLLLPLQIYASVFGTVKAIVHDPQHRPVKGAEVVVHSRTSSFQQKGITNEDGMAVVMKIPVGEYDVTTIAPGFTAETQSVTVISDTVEELHFALDRGLAAGDRGSQRRTANREPVIINTGDAGQPQ